MLSLCFVIIIYRYTGIYKHKKEGFNYPSLINYLKYSLISNQF